MKECRNVKKIEISSKIWKIEKFKKKIGFNGVHGQR